MSRHFGERLPAPPGERQCKHCAKGLSDHVLPMSEQRCYFPRNSTRFEPEPLGTDLNALDLDDHAALEQLFDTLLRGGDARQIVKRASTASAIRKLHVMHVRAKGESA